MRGILRQAPQPLPKAKRRSVCRFGVIALHRSGSFARHQPKGGLLPGDHIVEKAKDVCSLIYLPPVRR